jgi:hypothetical protein
VKPVDSVISRQSPSSAIGWAWCRAHGDALRRHGLGDGGAHVSVEAAQRQVGAVDHLHFGTQAVQQAGEFQPDIARAHHGDAPGQRLEGKQVVAQQAELGARDVRPLGTSAGGDEDMRGGDAASADIQRVGIQEGGAGVEDGTAGALQHARIDGRKPRHLGVPAFGELQPVMPVVFQLPAEGRRILRPHAVFGGVDHQLLRHAAHIDAGAAPEALLRHGDLGAVRSGDAGRAHAARAAADHEEIEVVGGHEQRLRGRPAAGAMT